MSFQQNYRLGEPLTVVEEVIVSDQEDIEDKIFEKLLEEEAEKDELEMQIREQEASDIALFEKLGVKL